MIFVEDKASVVGCPVSYAVVLKHYPQQIYEQHENYLEKSGITPQDISEVLECVAGFIALPNTAGEGGFHLGSGSAQSILEK